MKKALKISIQGVVQGVGFRPFIYNLAKKYKIKGFVENDTTGVFIEAEGEEKELKDFFDEIKTKHPPQAFIDYINSETIKLKGYKDFVIRESKVKEEKIVRISPDLALCENCLRELFNPSDRRYRYPFINCTNCGPRFTIIKDIPYDRKNTTMSVFKMCKLCDEEYHNPENRRFHAQPNACPVCGPTLKLIDNSEKEINAIDAVKKVCELLKDGLIVAIKGLGGYHLACDAKNDRAVLNLRKRKYREDKPFAIMAKDIEEVKKISVIDNEEEKLLKSVKSPIVLLKKNKESGISQYVAPVRDTFGIMLPYTPLHHLLLRESDLTLIMTSANLTDEPIAFKDEEAKIRLKKIADYFLIHNREIQTRCDDSVVRVFFDKEIIMRRARGYVPIPIKIPVKAKEPILACGGELKNTFCILKNDLAYVSHHIGDLENMETLSEYERGIEYFKKMLYVEPKIIAYDLHPEYLSTKFALSLDDSYRKIGIQHHHAHIAGCMAENNITSKVIGVAFDGLGYGTDGKLWGGEFLICDYQDFERVGNFYEVRLPGGEKAVKEPWRIAFSYLHEIYGKECINVAKKFLHIDEQTLDLVQNMIERNINSPLISSVGRLFDAVSSLLNLRYEVNYEGQAAIELEMVADKSNKEHYSYSLLEENNRLIVDGRTIIKNILTDIAGEKDVSYISSKFHNTIAEIVASVCRQIRERRKINYVVLAGGVFQNIYLLALTREKLVHDKFVVYIKSNIPTNDGGISLGQSAIACAKIYS